MIGRDAELQRIRAPIERARAGRSGAVVVSGDPGMGKTTLLDAADGAAPDFRSLRVQGVESESVLAHGGLLQLLRPVRDRVPGLPGPQRLALEGALGWGEPAAGSDHYLVAAATLSLLAASAEEQPVIVLVDDLQWLDAESASAILFAARRLGHDRVVMILATRDDSPGGAALGAIDRLELTGLSVRDAHEMLPGGTSTEVARRLTEATGGNPLALIEVANRLSVAQRRGGAPLPPTLPSAGRLDEIYAPVVDALSTEHRSAALVVAAADDPGVGPVVDALQPLGLGVATLDELERDGVLLLEPGTVRFVHPLLRSSLWSSASPAERRSAHRALAAGLPPGRDRTRVWHLAAATVGVDDELADALELIAVADERNASFAAASVAHERAARLSSDATVGATRLAAAAEDASTGGDVTRARRLLDELGDLDPTSSMRGRVVAALGFLEQCTGSLFRTEQLLAGASDLLAAAPDRADARLRVRVLSELCLTRHRVGHLDGLRAAARTIAAVADRSDPHQAFAADYFDGLVALMDGERQRGLAKVTAAIDLLASDPELRDDPHHLVPLVFAAAWIGITPELAALVESGLANARSQGALAALVPALTMTAHGRSWLGDNDAAFADAAEAVDLADELGFVDVAPAFEMLAWQYASRGDHDEAVAQLERAATLVERAGTTAVATHLALTRAYCAICCDDMTSVVSILEPWMAVDDGRGAQGEILGVAPLLIEGYAAIGDLAAAGELADRFGDQPDPDGRAVALAERCHGLATADDASAIVRFEAALQAHAAVSDAPFETARTQLLLGSRLRRAGRRAAARGQLRTARELFAGMGLTLWVDRCTAELGSAGETVRYGQGGYNESLTPQETRVAQLVCRGMTNAEVAAALFVSPKTVEHHLSSVYRKRGVRSRTELTAHMAG